MTGAGGNGEKLLVQGKVIIRIARATAIDERAHSRAIVARQRRARARPIRGGRSLRHSAGDVRPRRHQVGFLTAIGAWTPAGKRGEVPRAIGVGIPDIGTIISGNIVAPAGFSERSHAFGGTHGNHILGRSRRTDGFGVGTIVARDKHQHHRPVGGATAHIARQRIIGLRVQIITAAAEVPAPAIVANARPAVIRVREQCGIIRIGEIIRVEYDRRPHVNKRANAQAVLVSGGIDMVRVMQTVVPGDDMRVQIAVTIPAFERADRTIRIAAFDFRVFPAGRAFQTRIHHPAGLRGIPQSKQGEMIGRRRPVIDAAIADIHHKTGLGKLIGRESLGRQPREIPRAGGGITGQIPRDNLVLTFAPFARGKVGLNGNHIRPGGNLVEVGRIQPDGYVQIIRHRRAAPHRLELQLFD